MMNFSKKTIALVTGASQGIGRSIAIEFARKLTANSKIILLARSEHNLRNTETIISGINKKLKTEVVQFDLSTPDYENYGTLIERLITEDDLKNYEAGVIFHNAGQVGILKLSIEVNDIDAWKTFYDTNMFSTVLLNNAFCSKVKMYMQTYVVNITSLSAKQPMHDMAMYCSVKAARDQYFGVFALEENNIQVLSYSPGPVETDMLNSIIATSSKLGSRFGELEKQGKILTADQTVQKLLSVLEKGNYKSGEFVDYFGRTA